MELLRQPRGDEQEFYVCMGLEFWEEWRLGLGVWQELTIGSTGKKQVLPRSSLTWPGASSFSFLLH